MVYVSSDLHGCHPVEFQQFLQRSGFTDEDFLFVLGDVIDRGKYGAELLLWLTEQPNMQLVLGNHEALLLACSFLFEEVTEESLSHLTSDELSLVENWIMNGGTATLNGFRKLLKRDPELVTGILEYLQDAPLFEKVEVNGRTHILVHAGLEHFSAEKPLADYTPDELLLARPELETTYHTNAMVIFGHTPTVYFGEQFLGRAIRTNTWMDIDSGAAVGNHPMLLRLEDMKEFYW